LVLFFKKELLSFGFLFWSRTELQVVTWSGFGTTFVSHCEYGKGCTRTTLFGAAQIIGDLGGGGARGGAVVREDCGGLHLDGAYHVNLPDSGPGIGVER
jgi:hypothetical protein